MKERRMVLVAFMAITLALFVSAPDRGDAAGVGPPVTLKFSHQWPQDAEDYVIQAGIRFANEVNKRSGGSIKVQFYPAESLVKAGAQFKAMRQGTIDMSIYPLIYAAGEIPELNIVLVPWANTHENYFKFGHSPVWEFLEKKINAAGVKTLSWIQISGGIASRGKPVVKPADVKGMQIRAAGKYCQKMYADAGAGNVNMASSEVYNGMQRGLLDAVQTSSSSFASYKIYEVSQYYSSPEPNSIYFTCEPICIGMKAWEKLTPAQQKILLEVGKEMEADTLMAAKKEDKKVESLFAKNKNKVVRMTAKDYAEWRTMMNGSIEAFRKEVPNGDWLVTETLKLYK
jgi:TRAP-type C4-dicarboxylate transport system substrate-binding protein